jgi:hypothetical protein
MILGFVTFATFTTWRNLNASLLLFGSLHSRNGIFRATFYWFVPHPNFSDEASSRFCEAEVYFFTYTLVILFDLVLVVSFAFWSVAILGGEKKCQGLNLN